MKDIQIALTFDDVLLKPKYSEVLPTEVNVKTSLSKKFNLNIPIMSAGMDTVTELEMAFNMALCGGVGVIHKNLSIAQQANLIKQLKNFKNGFFYSIMAFESNNKIADIKAKIFDQNFDDCILVTDNSAIVNIVSKFDLENIKYDNDTTLNKIPHKKMHFVSESDQLEDILELMQKSNLDYLPVLNESKESIVAIAKKRYLIAYLNNNSNAIYDYDNRLKVCGAVGVDNNSIERIKSLYAANADAIVIDCAHGHSKKVIDLVKDAKKYFPKIFIIAGNVVTKDAVEDLIDAGADAIKVGVGPGSICTTRSVSGVGYPQFSAILECSQIAYKNNVSIIADGGIKTSGDITKALAAGADVVMLGSLLAGCEESPSEKVLYNDKYYKKYRGMGSIAAMKKGSADRYGQAGLKKFVAEGVEGLIPYSGFVKDQIYQLIGGLKSGMGYVGSKSISELQSKAEFVQQTGIGINESKVHSITLVDSKNK
ncbi:MAG: IMP dehydrogenase [Malacoplasma sp.]|nr:IMP dehydrogenase [Malacoplasma sp.]